MSKCSQGCPTGYIAHNGAFYKVYNQSKTYDQAREQCAADGGLLAMPKNKQLDAFLFRLKNALGGPGYGYFWFGLSYEHREGEWKWADGTPHNITADWGNWVPNQPEGCAHYSGWMEGWDSMWCDFSNKFICQLTHVCPGKFDGSDYRGNLSVTKSGRTCQRWDSNTPHFHHNYWPGTSGPGTDPDVAENYCRNPDSDGATLWCYTTDPKKRWEYCNNPACII
ncbi:PREDICTED: plasminogen-like [Branchiostoma belcheri]|uniref:Plasminogen-like n=1 Tax=Branchiostoma belcheri TaxID=7741 RepID=A0A6P4YR57_BRABE|nr:PREDICTED: plasminogen-like [Branchiostoma belcheri]